MSNENNKMQVDIENLFKQNVNDLSAIKELYRKLKEIEERILKIKYIDSTLANKLKKEYEKLEKIIMDENAQAKLAIEIETVNENLSNEIERINENLSNEIKTNNENLSNDIERINENLSNDIESINSQMDTIDRQVKSVINMEQFPRLDGEKTDTNRIKRAIDYSIEILKTSGIGSFKIIEFNSGNYIIDKEIQIPIFIKFKSIGNVIFISKVNGAMFKMYTPKDLNINQYIDNASARWSLYNGMWFNGIDGGITIIKDSSIDKEGSIALEIGNSINTSGAEYFTGWWNISNITICGFDIGIKFNAYNMFLGKFDKIMITKCNKGITFESDTVINSGESIAFNNSIFGDNGTCFYINGWGDLELIFNGCSFDFIEKGIETNKEGFYRFTNCHFEGIGFTNTKTEIGGDNACLIYSTGNYWNSPNIFINGCDFMTIRGELFKATQTSGMNLFINSLTSKGSKGFERLYAICNENVDVLVNNFVPSKYLTMITQRKLNMKINPNFDDIELNLDIKDNMKIDGYEFSTGFSNLASITNEKSYISGNKCLKINVPTNGTYLTIKSEDMKCKAGNKILSNFFWYCETSSTRKLGRMTIKTNFYDKDDNLITYPIPQMDAGVIANNSTNNEWNRPFYMEQVVAPKGAVKCKTTYTINPVEECTLYLSEFYSLIY